MEFIYTEKEIGKVAKEVLKISDARVFLLYAGMGVGKTTLIKELVKQLGAVDSSSSPSFSIVNEYASPQGAIYHFDFYRIKDPDEALDIGLEDYLYSGDYVFIEWPEKIAKFLPESAVSIKITINDNGSRTLKYMSVK